MFNAIALHFTRGRVQPTVDVVGPDRHRGPLVQEQRKGPEVAFRAEEGVAGMGKSPEQSYDYGDFGAVIMQ